MPVHARNIWNIEKFAWAWDLPGARQFNLEMECLYSINRGEQRHVKKPITAYASRTTSIC